MSEQLTPECLSPPYSEVGVQMSPQARRDSYIQAAMVAFGPLIDGDLKLDQAVAKIVDMGCNVMAAADKTEKENEDDKMCKVR